MTSYIRWYEKNKIACMNSARKVLADNPEIFYSEEYQTFLYNKGRRLGLLTEMRSAKFFNSPVAQTISDNKKSKLKNIFKTIINIFKNNKGRY